jgi:hypothetical protein
VLKAKFNYFRRPIKKENWIAIVESKLNVLNGPQVPISLRLLKQTKKEERDCLEQQAGTGWKTVPPKVNKSKVKHKDNTNYHWSTTHIS